MAATFTIKVLTPLRTATIGDLTQVVKEADWIMSGTESGQTFELPQTTAFPSPDSAGFVPFANLTEQMVAGWIAQNDTRVPAIQAHIQYVLDQMVAAAALTPEPAPWAPPAPPSPANPETVAQ